MIAKAPQRLGEPRIVGRNHAAFSGGQVLHGMKAEHGHVGNAADAFPAEFRAQRMAGVFNQDRLRFAFRQFPQFIKRGGMSRIIDRDDGLSCAK